MTKIHRRCEKPHQPAYAHSTILQSLPGIFRSLYLHTGWKPYTNSCMAKRKVELILGTRAAVGSHDRGLEGQEIAEASLLFTSKVLAPRMHV